MLVDESFPDLQIAPEDLAQAPPVDLDGEAIPEGLPDRFTLLLRSNTKLRTAWESSSYTSLSEQAFALMALAGTCGLTKAEAAAVHVALYARHGRKEDGIRKALYALRAWQKGRELAETRERDGGNGPPPEREPGDPGPAAAQEETQAHVDASVGVDVFLAPPPELDWDVVGVRVRRDHGWTGGAPKGMKGLTSLEEARACATGTSFLGRFPTRKSRVLYVSEEDRAERLHRRVYAMLGGRPAEEVPGPEDLRFLVKAGVRLDTPEGLAVLRWHLERWRPDLVFLEHFDRLHSGDVNKAADVKPLLDELDKLHAAFGCTFRVQKHYRKEASGQSRRPGEMLAGSVALFGWGESSIFLTLIRKGVAQVEAEAKDGDTAPRFLVEYQEGRIVYGGEVKTDKKEAARARVLEILDQSPGATTEAVAEGLKVTPRTAKTRLHELEAAGLVEGKQEHGKAPKLWRRIPLLDKSDEG